MKPNVERGPGARGAILSPLRVIRLPRRHIPPPCIHATVTSVCWLERPLTRNSVATMNGRSWPDPARRGGTAEFSIPPRHNAQSPNSKYWRVRLAAYLAELYSPRV